MKRSDIIKVFLMFQPFCLVAVCDSLLPNLLRGYTNACLGGLNRDRRPRAGGWTRIHSVLHPSLSFH